MNTVVLTEQYKDLPFCINEILHYAGCKEPTQETLRLLDECITEAKNAVNLKVCRATLSVKIADWLLDFGFFKLHSENLATNLKDCNQAVLFAATAGVGIDRLISKYGRISPAKAVMFQAIGTQQVEALCDSVCEKIKATTPFNLRPRFSPGYGDLSLQVQRDIFALLQCEKRIGLTLNDSLFMLPCKSVTAFVGLTSGKGTNEINKCDFCKSKACSYRRGKI